MKYPNTERPAAQLSGVLVFHVRAQRQPFTIHLSQGVLTIHIESLGVDNGKD